MAIRDAHAGHDGSAMTGMPLWAQDRTGSVRPPLEKDIDVDIAIVGAGFTGLWTAYYLLEADPTLRVAVLEREYAGFGASGRNGGWASAIFPVSLAHVAKLYDREAALALQRAMNQTVVEIGDAVAAAGIDCDYARDGFVSLARNDAQLARARTTVEASEAFGPRGQWELLSSAQAQGKIAATEVRGGIFTEHCALLQPDLLVRGLAAAVEAKGGTIYENTAVESIAGGVAQTPRGRVTADAVVRATEAFTPEFPEYRRNVAPLYSLVVATAPLPNDLREDLGLDGRTAFNDMRNLRIYAHPTSDGRLVFGGRGAPYHFNSRVDPKFDVDTKIHDKIVATMHEFFPRLRDVPVTHRWGGPLGVPRDWFPSVGYDRDSKLAWAGPYVGDGVATSNLAGRIVRNLLLDQRDDLNDLPIVNHRSKRWEVEPFRWLGVNAGLQAAAAADVEERATRKPSKISALLESVTGAH